MARPTNEEKRRFNISLAVSKMSPERIQKLKYVFSMDGTIREACCHAEISTSTYANWIKNNPDLLDEFEALRHGPSLRARKAICDGLSDPYFAFKYLEKKRPEEFGRRIPRRENICLENVGGIENINDPAVRAIGAKFELELKNYLTLKYRHNKTNAC